MPSLESRCAHALAWTHASFNTTHRLRLESLARISFPDTRADFQNVTQYGARRMGMAWVMKKQKLRNTLGLL